MADETFGDETVAADSQATAVAAQIAAVAESVVADANAAAAQGDEVNRALIAAQIGSVHAQRIEALERAREADSSELRAENKALAERLAQCETELKAALASVTALASRLETLSIPQPSAVAVVNDVEAGPEVDPESQLTEAPPPEPATPPRKLRHLI